MKGVSFNPSPYRVNENPNTMIKHRVLMQEYQDLQKETEAIKNRFENTKHHKSVLLAEIRFLRRRHKQLLVLRRKKRIPNEKKRRRVVCEAIKKEHILDLNKGEEVSRAPPPPVFDLNQIAREDHDDDGFRPLMMNETADEDQKLALCSMNAGKRIKRKISWQDPVVALKVVV
ncbi:uncharacterized protein LOC124926320 [Impatiens glandulifera]|uniref:uncharacterized protein LOC124926320 n=1 Tax=Impatiens glandulifera TaxID=253017 RepID=UPI001FB05D72|nr:uncharacterized protein LOC124926320 [Impatiens glandulifera]